MRVRWLTAAFLLVVLTVVWVAACGAAERPAERVSPAPEVNANAVIWRTPEPPAEAQAGDVWVNPKDGMEMVYVAAGEFVLGTSDAQIDVDLKASHPGDNREEFKDEQPQCRVNLPGYWIGRTEVTNAQYLRFVHATGHKNPKHWKSKEVPSGLESFPVVSVTWADAAAYCEWAGGRLPSEPEWEKAARGADGRVFPWGDQWDDKRCHNFELVTRRKYMNVGEWVSTLRGWNGAHDPVREGPAAVGSCEAGASPYGCLDMAGNVWEWCADWYDDKAYQRYAKGDLRPPGSGIHRVVRGGSWPYVPPTYFRCANRSDDAPDTCDYTRGFRCVRGLGLIGQDSSVLPAAQPAEHVLPQSEAIPEVVVQRTPEPPKEAQAGDVWVNPKDGMEMVYVPAGEFTLGSSDSQISPWLEEYKRERFSNEQPQCRVNLPAFWIGRTEVTQAQYARFLQETRRQEVSIPSGLERLPVVNLAWTDATSYCQWAGGRLPSELEWEKAARGTDGRIFPWGDKWDRERCRSFEGILGRTYSIGEDEDLSAIQQWLGTHDVLREALTAVGSYPTGTSPYGAADMAGNVSEWCGDWYEEKAYQRYARGDLKPPPSGTDRVLRGGSWIFIDLPGALRCARRDHSAPDLIAGYIVSGFRYVRGLP